MPVLKDLRHSLNGYIIIACFSALFAGGCTPEATQENKRTIFQFGTLIEVTLYGVEPERAEDTLDKLEADYARYHANWTPWQDSPLSQANRLLQSQPAEAFTAHASILPLIELSTTLSAKSQSLFNPAIGGLIRLWRFDKHDDPDIKPPDAELIKQLLMKNPTMQDLQLQGDKLQSSNSAVDLNFGAFAKGYAIDLSMAYLKSVGINNAVINAGGDLSVSGLHGDRPWKIGIRHPRKDGVIAWLEARDGESVFTSGDYERFYIYEGQRYHHILDPRTGYPSMGTSSVTVISDNAGLADAAATALFIAGPEQWQEIARALNIDQVMLIDNQGNIHMSPKMAKRIHLEQYDDYHIVLSEPL